MRRVSGCAAAFTYLRAHAAKPAATQGAHAARGQHRLAYLSGQRSVQHRVAAWTASEARAQLRSARSCLCWPSAPLGASISEAVDMPPCSASENVWKRGGESRGLRRRAARAQRLTFQRATSSGVSKENSVRSDGGLPSFTATQQRRGARKSARDGRAHAAVDAGTHAELAPRCAKSFARPTARRHIVRGARRRAKPRRSYGAAACAAPLACACAVPPVDCGARGGARHGAGARARVEVVTWQFQS